MVERFREQLSTEKLADRLARFVADAEGLLSRDDGAGVGQGQGAGTRPVASQRGRSASQTGRQRARGG